MRTQNTLKNSPYSLFLWLRSSLLFVFVVVWSTDPTAADERIRFHTYGEQDGLSGERVYAVHQDREGYLWVGSEGGLDRFDGHRFESFQHDEQDPSSLPGHRGTALLEDSMGRLWVGTDAGAALFDRETKSFRRFPLIPEVSGEGAASIKAPDVQAMVEDRRKILWFGTNQGLLRLALDSKDPSPEAIQTGFAGLVPGAPELEDPRVYAFAEDARGRLWIGTRSGLLRLTFMGEEARLDRFVYEPDDPESLHDNEIYALEVDRHGDLWIGAWGVGGLARLPVDQLEAREPRFTRFVYPEGDPRGLPMGVVKALHEDRDDNLWVGTQEGALCLLTAEERRREETLFHCMTHAPRDATSSPRTPFYDITQDAQGTLWFAAEGGLARHVPATAKIALVDPGRELATSAGSSIVKSLWEAHDGKVWVGTYEGLTRLSAPQRPGEPWRVERFLHDPDDPTSLSSNWIYMLYGDRRQQVWVGTVRGGLHRVLDDGPRPRFERYSRDSGITNSSVFSLFEDASGVLWVGTYQGFFHALAPSGPDRPKFTRLDSTLGTLSSELIYSIDEDASGRLWIGTDGGLDRLSSDRSQLETDLLRPGLVALQMLNGPDGHLWMVTGTEGLISVDPESEEWRNWGQELGEEGRPLGMAFDSLGRLWVTTKRQFHRLDPQTAELRTFGQRDGLRMLPFREQALHQGTSGRFFAGGAKGLAIFYPEELSQGPLLAPVVLRSLQIANETVTVDPEGPLPRSLETLDTLVLQPDDLIVSIEFAALTFHRQETVRYAHRLRGYSDEWIESGSDRRRATFTNLSPGDYTFEVRARGDVGSWGPEPATLKVRVLPEWYETGWVRGLVLVLGLGLPLAWLAFVFRREKQHRQELQSLMDRWQIERGQRKRWQELSVTAAQLAQQVRGPLERILHRARATDSDPKPEGEGDLTRQLLDPAEEALSKLDELVSRVVSEPKADTWDSGVSGGTPSSRGGD